MEIRSLPVSMRSRVAVVWTLEDLSTKPIWARAAARKGARPKSRAQIAEMPRAKSRTGLSGARLISSSDQAASRRVASRAKSQPSSEPAVTRIALSAKQLAEERPTAGPESETQGKFALANGISGDEQHDDVHASDQKHDRDHAHQHAQGLLVVFGRCAEAASGRGEEFNLDRLLLVFRADGFIDGMGEERSGPGRGPARR